MMVWLKRVMEGYLGELDKERKRKGGSDRWWSRGRNQELKVWR